MAVLGLRFAQQIAKPQPHREHAGSRSQLSRNVAIHQSGCRDDLAGLALQTVHRKRCLIVADRVRNVVHVVLIVHPALEVVPGILRLRDAEQVPVDLALEIERIGFWIIRIGALKFSWRCRRRVCAKTATSSTAMATTITSIKMGIDSGFSWRQAHGDVVRSDVFNVLQERIDPLFIHQIQVIVPQARSRPSLRSGNLMNSGGKCSKLICAWTCKGPCSVTPIAWSCCCVGS